MRLQIRLKPTRSLADLDVEELRARLAAIDVVRDGAVHDDRRTDAPFVTALVTVDDDASDEALAALLDTAAGWPRILPFLVDADGREHDWADLDGTDARRLAEVLP